MFHTYNYRSSRRIRPNDTIALSALAALALVLGSSAGVQAALLGPSAYTTFGASSPFAGGTLNYFHLETFDDHTIANTPGVTSSTGNLTTLSGFSGSIIDQVGSAGGCAVAACDTWFNGAGATGVTFTFNAAALGGSLPDAVGIVWTDGVNSIVFEAFDQNGASLGTVGGDHADGSFSGTIADDRFYGATHSGGISAIRVTSGAGGGIEVDDLQFGRRGDVAPPTGVPAPAALLLLGSGLMATGAAELVRRKR